jgi:hypothetical protein
MHGELKLTQIINHPTGIGFEIHKFLGTEGVKRVQKSNSFKFKRRKTFGLRTFHLPRVRRPIKREQRRPIAVIHHVRAVGSPTYPIKGILIIFKIIRIQREEGPVG